MKVAIPIIVALLFSTLTGLASAATPWRTTHFNVYFGAPELNNARARAQEMVSVDPDSPMEICAPESQHFCDQVKADMEGFLHDLAVDRKRLTRDIYLRRERSQCLLHRF